MAISEIRACFTFPLDNNGDILMLIEIIFELIRKPFNPMSPPYSVG